MPVGILKWFSKTPEAPAPEEEEIDPPMERESVRENAYAEAIVQTQHGQEKRGVLIDVSETGARIRFVSADGVMPGDTIRIIVSLKRIKRVGTIRWKDKTDIGVRFRENRASTEAL